MKPSVVKLRPATRADADFLLQLKNDPDSLRWSWSHDPVSAEDHEKWLAKALFHGTPSIYIAMVGKEKVGSIRTTWIGEGHEISFTVVKEHRGKGYGTKMLKLIPKEKNVPLIGYTDLENTASIRAFEKAGFKLYIKAVL